MGGTLSVTLHDKTTDTAEAAPDFKLAAHPFLIDPAQGRIRKDQTLHRWSSPNPGEPWFVELQLHSEPGKPDDPNAFKVCWHFRLPTVKRLVCVHQSYEPIYDRLTISNLSVLDDRPEGVRSYDLTTSP